MTRLLLLNGLPGTGKSTLAARYCADRPMSLCLDIDVVRGLVGGWLDRPLDAGHLARRVALSMIREVIPRGHDVVVPQLLARAPFIEELESASEDLGARFYEVVLLEPPDTTVARLRDRAAAPRTQAHRDAHVLLDRDGGVATVPELHRRLLDVLRRRPRTRIVEPVVGDVDRTYRTLIDVLDEAGP